MSVLTKRTANNFRKAYRFFKSQDLRYLQFIPCLRPFSGDYDEEMYMSCDDYSAFLTRGFNIYFNDYMRGEYAPLIIIQHLFMAKMPSSAEWMAAAQRSLWLRVTAVFIPAIFIVLMNGILEILTTHHLMNFITAKKRWILWKSRSGLMMPAKNVFIYAAAADAKETGLIKIIAVHIKNSFRWANVN